MSTTTTATARHLEDAQPSHGATHAPRSLLWAAIASEWTKLRSVRSTVYSLLATIAITVGFGALLSWAFVHRFDRLSLQERATFDATSHSLVGLFLAQLAIGVLGVLIISAEYTTGLVRPTFTAMPQRRTVLAAKAIVFGTVALVVSVVSCFSAFAIGQAILSSKHINVSLGDFGVFRAVCGACAYLVFVGLLGLGLGTILRRTAGAISALFGLVLVLPLLALVRPDVNLLSPGMGLVVCLVWLVATYVLATVLLSRRDA